MVIGHSSCPIYMWDFAYLFHKMPLFFFLAGYCFKEEYLLKPKDFILRRFSKLWAPFVVITMLFLLFHNLFVKLYLIEEKLYSFREFFEQFNSILFHLHNEEALIGGFWFVPQLLFASLISFMCLKFCNKYVALMLCFLFASLKYYVHLHIPYVSWVSFYAASFFIIGHIFAKNNFKITNNLGGLLISITIVVMFSKLMPGGIFVKQGWMLLPYLVVAIFGCVLTLNISNLVVRCETFIVNFLVYIGSKTMWVLTLHILAFKLITLLIIYINGDPITNLRVTPVYSEYSQNGGWIIYSIFGVLVPIFVSLVVKYINVKVHNRNKVINC